MWTLQKFLGFFLAFIFVAVSAAGALAQEQKRLAFVIGNAAYPSGALATPANDAGLIAQTLQAAGFDVVGARDVDQESLRGSLRDFLGKVSAAGPEAVVFVYLAGRGVQFEGENYFLPVDAQIANPTDVPLQGMRLSDITKSLAGLPTKVNIVVLDAARPNAFPKMNQPLAGGLALVDPDPNMMIAFNAAPGTVAPEGRGPYGAYAQALAEMMREGGLSLDDVFDRTRLRVNEVTQGAEVPWDASKISAPFVFFDRAPDAPAPKVSEAESQANRTRQIRDFDAHDAYVAALDRDTLRGYEDFLVAYPHDPMAKRVRAIVAARREAITWRETWLRDTPEAYWSYLRRYPHGPHAWDARRRLEHFEAALEPPEDFAVYAYDVPPPPEEEIVYVDRPVLYFDDPDFDLPPPPPVAVTFLPPPPPDFVMLPPPPPPVGIFVLPTPAFVPIPAWVDPPPHVVPPPDNVIFNNIHNTTIINNTTINNENNQAAQRGGLTTGQKLTGAAVGMGAAALATKVALPPLLQKKATLSNQRPVAAGKPDQAAAQGKQPGGATPLSKTLSTDHALPGANGKTLPLVDGKPPVLNGQNLPADKSKNPPGKQATLGGNQKTGNAVTAQGKGQHNGAGNSLDKNGKLPKQPTVNGAPAGQALNVPQKPKNNPNATSGQGNGKGKNLSAGQSVVVPSDQGSAAGNKKLRKPRSGDAGPAVANGNVQRNIKVSKPKGNPQPQVKPQQKPSVQALSKPQKPEFHAQPKPQVQARSVPQQPKPQQPKPQQPKPQQQQVKKKPSCGQKGEPACGK
ncbi:caspase domain-containing protein [Mesorhizobium sp. BAC0120]|uniref:caspase family protein n=1 Tax=Mesorhizobium sp. BAC0120 TaxID=3090670 RepID=UPI00298C2068|nr:caspase domain-containing protein [Mesorhizobium sp. BAC0120]MDW6024915.1 caspase domain-containing protein [Mesorhizobium sp. BAC0120]